MTETVGGHAGHTLVFVCGLHRSGTTQLAATLATHPDVSGMSETGAPHDEGQHLQSVYPTARSYGGPGRFAFDHRAHLTETSALASRAAGERLFAQWSAHWQLDRPVLVEKSPPNLIRMRFLQELFRDARFVVIVRHPLVTALATTKLATGRWQRAAGRSASLSESARHWFTAHRIMLDDLPHIRRLHLMRWEDLCAAPERQLADVAEFAGVDARFTSPGLDPSVDTRYAAQWERMRETDTREVRKILGVLAAGRDTAARFGYRADDPAILDPVPT